MISAFSIQFSAFRFEKSLALLRGSLLLLIDDHLMGFYLIALLQAEDVYSVDTRQRHLGLSLLEGTVTDAFTHGGVNRVFTALRCFNRYACGIAGSLCRIDEDRFVISLVIIDLND